MLHRALRQITANALSSLRPPPPLTVSSWADTHRRLSPEASAEPGQWRTSRAEYQRGILDAFNDPRTHTVVVMSSAQVGKTEILNNLVAFFVAHEPAPVLVLQPTLEMSEAWSKDRLAPMLRDTPELAGKVSDAKARNSGNTLLHKSFPGGHITMAGANSPASLASRPIRAFFADEVDRYPKSAGTEGDPVKLGSKRTATFWNRRIGLFSTPTIKGASRIETAFLGGDQRYYHLNCPHCDHEQRLRWANVKWSAEDAADARYACEACGVLWSDGERYAAIKRGRWIASAPFKGVASFHLSELYSPWRRLAETAADFLEAKKGGPEMLKVWTNTALGETWEQAGTDKQDPGTLQARALHYAPLTIPEQVVLLTAGVDSQNDRLAVSIWGWSRGERAALVWWGELFGDPAEDAVWDQLDELMDRQFEHPNGEFIGISGYGVDSGGQRTQYVYDYCRRAKRAGRPVFAIKGSNQRNASVISRPTKVDITLRGREAKGGVDLFNLGVSTIKDTMAARLRLTEPTAAGYLSWYDAGEDYFRQLTSEHAVQRFTQGQLYYQWEKVTRDARNEGWDTLIYAYGVARLIGIERANWTKLEQRFGKQEPSAPETAVSAEAPSRKRRKAPSGFRSAGGFAGMPGR